MDKPSFSRDQAVGVLAYLIKTKDRAAALRWLDWITNNNGYWCTDYISLNEVRADFCNIALASSGTGGYWDLMGYVWLHIGLSPNSEMVRAMSGNGHDQQLTLQSLTAPLGFHLHLVAAEIYLREQMNQNSLAMKAAADTIDTRQVENPFFKFLRGDVDTTWDKIRRLLPTTVKKKNLNLDSLRLTSRFCPRAGNLPKIMDQWAWERARSDQAWKKSMLWDCIFITNLLAGGPGPGIGKISSDFGTPIGTSKRTPSPIVSIPPSPPVSPPPSPPTSPTTPTPELPTGIRWIPASNGQVPADALQGGEEKDGTPLFICRAKHRNEFHPGKTVDGNCNTTYRGTEIVVSSYEVLTGVDNPDWQFASNGEILPGAFQGGQELNRRLFICRIPFKDGLHPGKVVGKNCNIGFEGAEIVASDYELLVPQGNRSIPSRER